MADRLPRRGQHAPELVNFRGSGPKICLLLTCLQGEAKVSAAAGDICSGSSS